MCVYIHVSIVCLPVLCVCVPVFSVYVYISVFSVSECLVEDAMFFIVSPKDVVVARQRDKDDHIQWLLEHAKFEVSPPTLTSVAFVRNSSVQASFTRKQKWKCLMDLGLISG